MPAVMFAQGAKAGGMATVWRPSMKFLAVMAQHMRQDKAANNSRVASARHDSVQATMTLPPRPHRRATLLTTD